MGKKTYNRTKQYREYEQTDNVKQSGKEDYKIATKGAKETENNIAQTDNARRNIYRYTKMSQYPVWSNEYTKWLNASDADIDNAMQLDAITNRSMASSQIRQGIDPKLASMYLDLQNQYTIKGSPHVLNLTEQQIRRDPGLAHAGIEFRRHDPAAGALDAAATFVLGGPASKLAIKGLETGLKVFDLAVPSKVMEGAAYYLPKAWTPTLRTAGMWGDAAAKSYFYSQGIKGVYDGIQNNNYSDIIWGLTDMAVGSQYGPRLKATAQNIAPVIQALAKSNAVKKTGKAVATTFALMGPHMAYAADKSQNEGQSFMGALYDATTEYPLLTGLGGYVVYRGGKYGWDRYFGFPKAKRPKLPKDYYEPGGAGYKEYPDPVKAENEFYFVENPETWYEGYRPDPTRQKYQKSKYPNLKEPVRPEILDQQIETVEQPKPFNMKKPEVFNMQEPIEPTVSFEENPGVWHEYNANLQEYLRAKNQSDAAWQMYNVHKANYDEQVRKYEEFLALLREQREAWDKYNRAMKTYNTKKSKEVFDQETFDRDMKSFNDDRESRIKEVKEENQRYLDKQKEIDANFEKETAEVKKNREEQAKKSEELRQQYAEYENTDEYQTALKRREAKKNLPKTAWNNKGKIAFWGGLGGWQLANIFGGDSGSSSNSSDNSAANDTVFYQPIQFRKTDNALVTKDSQGNDSIIHLHETPQGKFDD